jgi:multisubunit Na+/H+ antiporter MnhB subunit
MSNRNIAAVVFFSIVAVFFVFSALMMHPFGAPDKADMDDGIITNAQNETGANNGVTAVVFDYRGFDTLGEATILFTAVAGVIMIFRRLNE